MLNNSSQRIIVKFFKKLGVTLICSIAVGEILAFFQTKIQLAETELALAEARSSLFKMSGLLWRGYAPVDEWSEEIPINGHPFHLWTGNYHRHYRVMINGTDYPNVIEEGETPDFPGNVQTLRLKTVDGDNPIFFEIPGY
jgi:hypothetical protein